MARPKNIEESEKVDRSIVNLEVDMFVLKPTEMLVLPETPNIYLTNEKAKWRLNWSSNGEDVHQ